MGPFTRSGQMVEHEMRTAGPRTGTEGTLKISGLKRCRPDVSLASFVRRQPTSQNDTAEASWFYEACAGSVALQLDAVARFRARSDPGLQTQALAALGTTSVDDLTATTGLHAHQKTVGAGTTDLGRLISAFHFWILKAEPAIRSNLRQLVNVCPIHAGYTCLVTDLTLAKNLWITSTPGPFPGLESRPHFKTCPHP